MSDRLSAKYGFIKPALDAHTLGVNAAAELLRDCGYEVSVADDFVAKAMNDYKHELRRKVVVDWVVANKIERLGISYRLDQEDAINMVGYLIEELKMANLMKFQGGQIESLFFGGLSKTCEAIEKEFNGLVRTFVGGETAKEALIKMGVSEDRIPRAISEGSKHDDFLMAFGKEMIDSQEYLSYKPIDRATYPGFGTMKDTLTERIDANRKDCCEPLMRAHVGPYSSTPSFPCEL